MKRGQRNNYTYGRMTLEEIKAEAKFDIGRGFEILMENHPETVRDRVRDID
jgi:3-dehydroquinate dehydratase